MTNQEIVLLGIKIGDWLQIGAFLLAVIGLYNNTKEKRRSNTLERIKIISNTINNIYKEKELSTMLYKFVTTSPPEPFIYTKEFHGSKKEMILDKLLIELDFLANHYYDNILKIKDFSTVKEIYLDIYNNKEIKKYFNYLDDHYKSINKKNEFCLNFRNISKVLIESQKH